MRGAFVTIEGLDFSGKSTLVRHLKELLPEGTYFTREPGGTVAAERIRELVLDPEVEMDSLTEAYLYAAARADHVRRVILPRLEAGESVVCERYLDSSLAYQGAGRDLGVEEVRSLNAFAVRRAGPDRTFYLKLDAAERERRAGKRGEPDRLERAGRDFMARAEAAFDRLAGLEPERITVLDATLPPDDLAARIAACLGNHRKER
ncbi:dTMP kinase [Rubrobacter indicoceani]|uniref:dTMP kinase n=1 Tax=Rubrobacter indicoceani TaxID=2051957 RepID=UPI000E5B37AD|nr:dTMP kinase [Rubrobacter indicoceani]